MSMARSFTPRPGPVDGSQSPLHERLRLPLTRTREDAKCPEGRLAFQRISQHPSGQEVVLVPELRIAYVEVRKCGSATIRSALATAFNASFLSCGGRAVPEQCGSFQIDAAGKRRPARRLGCLASIRW